MIGAQTEPSPGPPADLEPNHGAPRLGTPMRRSELRHLPNVEELVEGILSTPAAIVLVGSYGTGKTVLVHGLCCSVSTGRDWLGRKVQQRRALIVVGEGAYGLEDRIAAWEHAWHGGRPIPDDALTFAIKPSSLAKLATWQQLTEYAVAEQYGLIVLDTFSSLAPDADETKDAALIMRHLSDLSSAINGTVILVHHPGWADKSRVRGGYQFEANADEVLVLTGVEGSALVSLNRKKVKDGQAGATIWLNRTQAADSVIFEQARASDAEVPIRQRIITALSGYAEIGATGPQLMDDCGVDPKKGRAAFYKALKPLLDDDKIHGDGPRGRTRYWLTDHAPEDPT